MVGALLQHRGVHSDARQNMTCTESGRCTNRLDVQFRHTSRIASRTGTIPSSFPRRVPGIWNTAIASDDACRTGMIRSCSMALIARQTMSTRLLRSEEDRLVCEFSSLKVSSLPSWVDSGDVSDDKDGFLQVLQPLPQIEGRRRSADPSGKAVSSEFQLTRLWQF